MEISRDSLSADFETGWKRFETSASLRDSYSTDLLLSVLRRKFSTKVEIIYTHFDFVALRVDLSEIKVRVSAKSLVCLIRIKKGSIDTAEAFRLLTTAHFADSPAGYCTIAIVCGESNELKSKCRSSFLDLVILDYKQMKSIITAEEWSIAISRVLGEEKSPRILSPYDETGICPAEMFFGRDEELQRLTSHARGHGYSLVGCRRVGKSSLLLRIKRHYDERGETTYYIDCQTCHSTETFYDEIVKRTNRRDYESRKKWTLKGYLMRLASISRKPLNLFLDEMDWVVAWDKTNKYQYIIKELLSAERTTVPIRVWMAGFKDLYWAVTDRDGPLYGKSNAVELKPLPYNKVKDLILKPSTQLGYEFENKDSIINRIYSDAAGHPSFTQLYCRLLVDVMTEEKETKIKIAHLDADSCRVSNCLGIGLILPGSRLPHEKKA